jgi:hypothetical protein
MSTSKLSKQQKELLEWIANQQGLFDARLVTDGVVIDRLNVSRGGVYALSDGQLNGLHAAARATYEMLERVGGEVRAATRLPEEIRILHETIEQTANSITEPLRQIAQAREESIATILAALPDPDLLQRELPGAHYDPPVIERKRKKKRALVEANREGTDKDGIIWDASQFLGRKAKHSEGASLHRSLKALEGRGLIKRKQVRIKKVTTSRLKLTTQGIEVVRELVG